jgi:hypothetical protein
MNLSQITLVNYSTPNTLLFSKDSMISTEIFYHSYEGDRNRMLYTVSMNGKAGDCVEVHDHQRSVAGVIKWKTFGRDTVFFPMKEGKADVLRGKEIAWDKWLVPRQAEDGQ